MLGTTGNAVTTSLNLFFNLFSFVHYASLVSQMVKTLPAIGETWVQSLGWEDPLEKGMATLSSTLTWEIPWMGEPGRLQSMGSRQTRLSDFTFTFTLALQVILFIPKDLYIGHPQFTSLTQDTSLGPALHIYFLL